MSETLIQFANSHSPVNLLQLNPLGNKALSQSSGLADYSPCRHFTKNPPPINCGNTFTITAAVQQW